MLTWNDATPVDYVGQTNFGNPSSEIAFRIETSPAVGVAYTTLAFAPSNTTTFTDTSYNVTQVLRQEVTRVLHCPRIILE